MAFHELGANAIKYGALSVAEGHASIRWLIASTGDMPELELSWTQSGGPALPRRSHTGFDSILTEQAFAQHGSDAARVKFLPSGVVFEARFEPPSSPLGSHS